MKVAQAKFDNAVLSFVETDILPSMEKGWKTWVFAGAMPLLMPQAHTMLMQFGLETAEGVDIDAIETFLRSAFKGQATLEVPLIHLGFDASDGEKLIASLRK